MVKKLSFLILALTFAPIESKAGDNPAKVVGKIAHQALKNTVVIELQGLSTLGLSVKGNTIVVSNATPFDAVVTIYGTAAALLEPGEQMYLNRKFVPLRSVGIPVLVTALFFDSTNYIGAAIRYFSINSNQSSENWILEMYEIRTPVNQYLDPRAYPAAKAKITVQKIDFPRKWYDEEQGAADIQITNNTLYKATLKVDGVPKVELNTGDLYPLRFTNSLRDGYTVNLEVVFTDYNDYLIGTWSTPIYVPGMVSGINGYQYLITPGDIRYVRGY